MSKEESGQQQMQAEQPKEEPKLTSRKTPPSVRGTGGTADLGYLTDDGDAKFQRTPKDIATI